MSVYLGSQLEDVFTQIQRGTLNGSKAKAVMNLGVDTLPDFTKDPGDRNRTSPFAFTGNRFEFRAVGSSQSVSGPLVAMNTMLADSLNWMADKLEASIGSGSSLNAAILAVLKVVMDEHGAVVFGGNGYTAEWHNLAEERGLANLPTCAEALPVLKEKHIEELFSKAGVLTPAELASRFEVYAEQYINAIGVETRLVVAMATTQVYPAAMSYLSSLSETLTRLSALKIDAPTDQASKVAALAKSMMASVAKLSEAAGKHDFVSVGAPLSFAAKTGGPLMDGVRKSADLLEAEVADEHWPLPTYQEMLFIR
jgi:glutamine synthetase